MSATDYGANWDELGADGTATQEELTARVMELATGARTAVVTIGGLLCGARKYMWAEDRGAKEYLDAIDEATLALASLLPENREPPRTPVISVPGTDGER